MERLLAIKMLNKTFTKNGYSNIVVDPTLLHNRKSCVLYYTMVCWNVRLLLTI